MSCAKGIRLLQRADHFPKTHYFRLNPKDATMTKTKGVIILGSARGDGNTAQAVSFLCGHTGFATVNLSDHRFGQYDYLHRNQKDEFGPLLKRLMEDYETWIFATPVYWYSMSGIMKSFFDRLTDLLDLHPLGKMALQGKRLGLVCCSSNAGEIEGFEIPFRETAIYMSMLYLGFVHTWIEQGELPVAAQDRLQTYASSIAGPIEQ
jgi:hypothetical protein